MKEYEEFGETEHLANEPYTIKVKYHEGASRIGSDIHGVMCDLAASETVELKKGEKKIIPLGVSMKLPDGYFGLVVPRSSTCINCGIAMGNSVGIIENDYCGENDVWGFVAIALEDTTIEAGTRIAQFMPVAMHDWATTRFEEPEEWPYPNRGGYGSTGEKSGEEPVYRDMNGYELHVGDFVTDEWVVCHCIMGLHISDGLAYADIGNRDASVTTVPCRCLELDERPHDCDGVPIEVGDVLYRTNSDGEPIGDPLKVDSCIDETFFAYGHALPLSARMHTHREPDSFEKIAADSFMFSLTYCKKRGLGLDLDISNMRDDLISRMKAVAARG